MTSTMTTGGTAGANAAPIGIMDRLRAETGERHKRAEEHRFQRALLSGRLERAAYAAWLGQMLIVHRDLESAIDRARPVCPHLAVVTDEQRHSANLEADLRTFGVDPAGVRPMSGALWLRERIRRAEAERPIDLLGMHYVLEGSMNGNKFIAMAVRKGLGLTAGMGDRYLDPYGERQRAVWAEWKAAMGGRSLAPEEMDSMVSAACDVFDGVSRISEDLMPSA